MDVMNNNLVIERKFRPIRVLKLRNISPVSKSNGAKVSKTPLHPPIFFSPFRLPSSLWLLLPMSQCPNLPTYVLAFKPRPHNGYSDSESIYFPRGFRILGTFLFLSLSLSLSSSVNLEQILLHSRAPKILFYRKMFFRGNRIRRYLFISSEKESRDIYRNFIKRNVRKRKNVISVFLMPIIALPGKTWEDKKRCSSYCLIMVLYTLKIMDTFLTTMK